MLDTIIFTVIAYLFGSISSAIVVCKILRLPDPRTQGSGNPGATNVLRIGGKRPAIVTLLGDILKGAVPVLAAEWYGLSTLGLSAVALAAFLGHIFPIYFRFQGGKGVATAFGCLIALAWPAGLTLAGTWLIVAVITRYSSLAALVATVFAPLDVWIFTQQWDYTLMTVLISLILFYRHKSNIQKLVRGEETKIGQKSKTSETL